MTAQFIKSPARSACRSGRSFKSKPQICQAAWYFLAASTAPVVIPESLIDLRDLHSVPRVVLEQLIAGGKRVASLASPYREHLAQHFAVTYMRVALPEPYSSQP